MSLKPGPIGPVPEETARVARAAFRKGNPDLSLRDGLGRIFADADFGAWPDLAGSIGAPFWQIRPSYYTVDGASYEVVTTVAPTHDALGAPGAPARFAASLLPGQKQTVAVGSFGTEAAPTVLEVARAGDTLSARILPARQRLASR